MDCVFCQIVAGELPADVLLRDERVMVFRDIEPVAPVHLVVVPNEHFVTLDDLDDPDLGGALLSACSRAAEIAGLANGYRVVANVGPGGGQFVPHLHLHVLGGRRLTWPPG